jgi:hypothetical protein
MKALTMTCAFVLCVCWAAFAYPADTITVRFANPVVVGETTLPAGNVTISVQRGTPNVMLTFRAESGATVTAIASRISDLDEDRPDTLVVLTHEGNSLKVDRILLGDHTGFALAQ